MRPFTDAVKANVSKGKREESKLEMIVERKEERPMLLKGTKSSERRDGRRGKKSRSG